MINMLHNGETKMTQLNSDSFKIFVSELEIVSLIAGKKMDVTDYHFDVVSRDWVKYLESQLWIQVPKILGDVKGNVSQEDRQLLKIVKAWNDEQVDIAIEQYILEYKKYNSKLKVYGKESWRCI